MAKLYFRYGTVGSAKTLNLLAVAHAYRQQGKNVLLVKPKVDNRFGTSQIRSRAGITMEADVVLDEHETIPSTSLTDLHCILVDEVQFLTTHHIEQLRTIACEHHIPVICYGLRTDFRRQLFPGSKRLLELADAIEEIKTTCVSCNAKAVFNLKLVDGKPTLNGPTIALGCEETYQPYCASCYNRITQSIHRPPGRVVKETVSSTGEVIR